MVRTNVFIFLVLVLMYARGSPLHEESEKSPSKSEIMSRIKRLLQMLHEKEQESVTTKYEPHKPRHHSFIPEKRKMLERRKKLEILLKKNRGLRTLLKAVLEKRKKEEMLQNDPQCIPGLFYCRDESLNEEKTTKRESLKMIHKEQDSAAYCPPGFFYCPENSDDSKKDQKDRLNLFDVMFPERKSRTQLRSKEMQELDRIVRIANDQKESKDHPVEVVTIPASVRKIEESDEAKKAKSTHGEKLADDLVKSLQDTGKKINDKPSNEKETNFEMKQLIELLTE